MTILSPCVTRPPVWSWLSRCLSLSLPSRPPTRWRRKVQAGRRSASPSSPTSEWWLPPVRKRQGRASRCFRPAEAPPMRWIYGVQTVLGLVEPQSSRPRRRRLPALLRGGQRPADDLRARETAPADATPELFLGSERQAACLLRCGGRRTLGRRARRAPPARPCPCALRRKALASLLDPAIRLRATVSRVSPRLASAIAEDADRMASQQATKAYFLDAAGAPHAAGATLKNPAYTETISDFRRGRADAFLSRTHGRANRRDRARPRGQIRAVCRWKTWRPTASRSGRRPARPIAASTSAAWVHPPPAPSPSARSSACSHPSISHTRPAGPRGPGACLATRPASAFADRERYLGRRALSPSRRPPRPHYLVARSALLRRLTALGEGEAKAGEPPWDKAEIRLDGQSLEVPSTRISSSSTLPATLR